MITERFKPFAAAYLVLRNNDEILLLQRANTGYYDGSYSLVAGHLDGGETAQQCIVREALEEAGITVKIEDLSAVHVIHRLTPTREYIDLFVTANKWQGEITNKEPDKCMELKWFKASELPDNMIPEVRQALDNIEKGVHYSEYGW